MAPQIEVAEDGGLQTHFPTALRICLNLHIEGYGFTKTHRPIIIPVDVVADIITVGSGKICPPRVYEQRLEQMAFRQDAGLEEHHACCRCAF